MRRKRGQVKTWMVEGRCKLNGLVIPIRSVVEAASKKAAQSGANKAVDDAIAYLAESRGVSPVPPRFGDAIALYPIA